MTLLMPLDLTAIKRMNRLLFLIEIEESLVRIHMSQERKFQQRVQLLFLRLRPRPRLCPHPRLHHCLPIQVKSTRILLLSSEFWRQLAVRLWKNYWLETNRKLRPTKLRTKPSRLLWIGPSLLRTDPRRLLRMELQPTLLLMEDPNWRIVPTLLRVVPRLRLDLTDPIRIKKRNQKVCAWHSWLSWLQNFMSLTWCLILFFYSFEWLQVYQWKQGYKWFQVYVYESKKESQK